MMFLSYISEKKTIAIVYISIIFPGVSVGKYVNNNETLYYVNVLA